MLLTGFQGYGGRSDNPSAQVVEALAGSTIAGQEIIGEVLPVTNHDLQSRITALLDQHKPTLLICLGLAPGENMVRIERLAANYSRFEIPDNAGDRFEGAICADGPAAYDSTLPVKAIRERLLQAGIPARVSESAGTFLCNAIMYHSLHHCAGSGTRAGFIHLPYLPSQVSDIIRQASSGGAIELHQRADLASMALDIQIEAIRLAIAVALDS
jgi:pyroglutamyl-peptidase